jgi:hypothetical protein
MEEAQLCCQRRREDASADRSKDASRRAADWNTAFQFDLINLLSRPAGRGAQRRGWKARSHAQQREHGEHRTFPAEHRGMLISGVVYVRR